MARKKDPYRYFRLEARDLLEALQTDTLAIERTPDDGDALQRILRNAHTFKGAAGVVGLDAVVDQIHAIESILSPLAGGGEVPAEAVQSVLDALDVIGARLAEIDESPGPPAARQADAGEGAPAPAPETESPPERDLDDLATVRVEMEDLSRVSASVSLAAVEVETIESAVEQHLERASTLAEELEAAGAAGPRAVAMMSHLRSAGEALRTQVDRARTAVTAVDGLAQQLQLVPVGSIAAQLERSVRDAARTRGVEARFVCHGGRVRVEAHVLSQVRVALLHVVRNAVAHGLEGRDERRSAGKPEVGTVTVAFEQRAQAIEVRCSDDGRGVDIQAVQRRAVERGLPSGGSAEEQLMSLFEPGFSTRSQSTTLAGRGVGLDVVRKVIEEMGGAVDLSTEPGEGTTLRLTVPLQVSAIETLEVEAGSWRAALPLHAVSHVSYLPVEALVRTSEGLAMRHEGEAIPFGSLAKILEAGASLPQRRAWTAVVVQAEDGLAAIGVDRLHGVGTHVVRPLPASVGHAPLVMGAGFDELGVPHLVYSPAGLVAGALRNNQLAEEEARLIHVLVIDDSMTTRMMLESVLIGAGFDVELAVDAEQGLEKARAGSFRLILCDVEMPGMNGFEFAMEARSDPDLRHIPLVLVTTLATPEDRQRGLDAGARAYFVKTEFDEPRFLQTIAGLLEVRPKAP